MALVEGISALNLNPAAVRTPPLDKVNVPLIQRFQIINALPALSSHTVTVTTTVVTEVGDSRTTATATASFVPASSARLDGFDHLVSDDSMWKVRTEKSPLVGCTNPNVKHVSIPLEHRRLGDLRKLPKDVKALLQGWGYCLSCSRLALANLWAYKIEEGQFVDEMEDAGFMKAESDLLFDILLYHYSSST